MTTRVEKWKKLNQSLKESKTPPEIEKQEERFEGVLLTALRNFASEEQKLLPYRLKKR